MAITLQATPVTNGSNLVQSTLTQSFTVSAGSNMVLVVAAVAEDGGLHDATGVTWNGTALTSLIRRVGTSFANVELFILKAPATGTFNIVGTWDAAGRHGLIIFVLEGVDQTTTNRTPNGTNANTGTASSVTVASVAAGDYIVDVMNIDNTGHSPAPGADQTALHATLNLGAGTNESRSSNQDGANGGVMSWTWGISQPNAQVAVAFIPAASGTIYTDSGTVVVKLTPSSTEFKEILEIGSIYVDLQASSVEVFAGIDASTVPVTITPSVVEGKELLDADTVYVDLQASATENAQLVDTSTVPVALTPSATEAREETDANTVILTLTPSATENAQLVEIGNVRVTLTPSGTETMANDYVDSGTIPLAITPSSTDVAADVDASTIYVDLDASATEFRTVTDTSTIPVVLTPSGSDVLTSGYVDSATVSLKVTPTGTDTFQAIETNTAYVTLTPSASETYTTPSATDAATVYVKITPATVLDIYYPFDSFLVGTLSRHFSAVLTGNRFSATVAPRRWAGVLNDNRFSFNAIRRWSATLGRK